MQVHSDTLTPSTPSSLQLYSTSLTSSLLATASNPPVCDASRRDTSGLDPVAVHKRRARNGRTPGLELLAPVEVDKEEVEGVNQARDPSDAGLARVA